MTLRVAHVLNSPGTGGVPRVARALVGHTDPARVAPHVFYLKPGNGADLFDDIDLPRRVAPGGSKADAMADLVEWLDRHRIDILHSHSYRPNLYGRMAGAVLRPRGLRIVAHYHNDYSDKWTGAVLALERRLADVTDIAVAVSASVASHVVECTGLVPEVIANGIDRERVTGGDRDAGRSALGLTADCLAVGLIGRICRQKGTDIFVEAAIRLCAKRADARFVLLGDAEDAGLAESLRDRIGRAGLAGRIIFAGHREDMGGMLAALDLVAAPSRWEGFGLMLAEAMAAGVPVIASDIGGIPSVIGGAGRLVRPGDAGALADAIRSLLDDPDARETLRDAGRLRAQRFDWARSASQVEALYRRITRAPAQDGTPSARHKSARRGPGLVVTP